MLHVMRQIMRGELTQAQIAGFIIGLRVKKETVGENRCRRAGDARIRDHGASQGSRARGRRGRHRWRRRAYFNISTAATFVSAAAGAKVAKHGNRSVSSRSGSADVLEALGAKLDLAPADIARSIETIGVGFMYAPSHHPAMKHAGPVRKELGVRTIFNILGPLTNPAGAQSQLLGVFHPDLVGIQTRVLQRLGAKHVMVVHGRDGLDEISISGETFVGELVNGEVREYELHPSQFGLEVYDRRAIQVKFGGGIEADDPPVLENQPGPR
jgi:anthranilate phosphoribosyltransferase